MSALTYLSAASGTADVQLRSAPVAVRGVSATESVGATASFVLRDGNSVAGAGVVFVQLNANESVIFEFEAEGGIEFRTGLYLDRVSGTTEVAVWV